MNILLIKSVDHSFFWLAKCFEELGHSVVLMNEKDPQKEILEQVEKIRPDFVLVNNWEFFASREDGVFFEDYFDRKAIPVAAWFYETPYFMGGLKNIIRFHHGPYPKALFFLVESGYCDFFEKRGMTCKYLPFAANPIYENYSFDPSLLKKFDQSMSYIGSPYCQPKEPLEDSDLAILDFHANRVRENFLHLRLMLLPQDKKFHPIAFASDDLMVDEIYELFANLFFDRSGYSQSRKALIEKFALWLPKEAREAFRLAATARIDILFSVYQQSIYLRQLVTQRGLKLYGGDSWNQLISAYREPTPRLSEEDMYHCYRGSKIVFNFTKFLFKSVVHERTFHVFSAGGFPLSDYKSDLEICFQPDEYAAYRSLEELMSLSEFYLKNDEARQRIIAKGRERVFRQHTYKHRAMQMIDMVCEHFNLDKTTTHRAMPLPMEGTL